MSPEQPLDHRPGTITSWVIIELPEEFPSTNQLEISGTPTN